MTRADARNAAMTAGRMPAWAWLVPAAAAAVLAIVWSVGPGTVLAAISAAVLIGAVIAAVHHAEVVAHRVGEPFGTLVLALAITVIEVALIVSIMLSGTDAATRHRRAPRSHSPARACSSWR